MLLPVLLLLRLVHAQCTAHNSLAFLSPVSSAPAITATAVFSNLSSPRGIVFDSHHNLLVVERGLGITAFTSSSPTCNGWLRTVVVQNANFTQGLQVHENSLYVSTSGEVWRYVYDPLSRTVHGGPQVVINGIPPDGELTTRPILLHPPTNPSTLLVSCSLASNIDLTARLPSSGRSQIRSFSLLAPPPQPFFTGTLLAYGIRNPAAFAFLPSTRLWVVDNGASIDNVTGLTAAFVNDNPADELNLVDLSDPAPPAEGRFYGFPDCTTIWNPDADPVGDPQYTGFERGAQFSLLLEPERGNAWCQDVKNNVPPRLSFQAHSVPLDLKFFFPTPTTTHSSQSLPHAWAGDAFVTFHGSFDRTPPTGYAVVRVPFSQSEPAATAGDTVLVQASDLATCPGTCIRPVGLAFSHDGRLFVSSDSSGELFVISAA
ncbi:hypothetical protein PHLCEN_2v2820 [Hermanssonia centrifuga]|uniref:Pyrroloquinoline quinone-dependent pyranose dehydrogenase beta-propeller domain-containing protein n=1 Tax=Hermanssonia centrifuga TaxID=98765 RepID=A0A2R6RI19_9APHY|nr:hypothetical protein PHLCEN_2v2820 [Hermanssonia centrifuga]